MSLTRLGHVALIVPDVEAAIEHFRRMIDWDEARMIYERDIEDVDKATGNVTNSHTALIPIGDSFIELIQPLSEGPLMNFLKRTGGGFHHVGLVSDDVRADWDRQAGQRDELGVLGDWPTVNDRGVSFWFLHPKRNQGLMLEIDAAWLKTSASSMTPIEPTPDWDG
jgi:catechol 2,3-dioxygenase-like lactoylglutathione lyase family enzyme